MGKKSWFCIKEPSSPQGFSLMCSLLNGALRFHLKQGGLAASSPLSTPSISILTASGTSAHVRPVSCTKKCTETELKARVHPQQRGRARLVSFKSYQVDSTFDGLSF